MLAGPKDFPAHIFRRRQQRLRGRVEVEVAASEDMMRGVVSLPHGYGHRQPGVRLENATMLRGVSVNDLTDPARTDVSGNAVLNGVPVSVTPCA